MKLNVNEWTDCPLTPHELNDRIVELKTHLALTITDPVDYKEVEDVILTLAEYILIDRARDRFPVDTMGSVIRDAAARHGISVVELVLDCEVDLTT